MTDESFKIMLDGMFGNNKKKIDAAKNDVNSPPGIVISSPPVKTMLPGIGDTKETTINIVVSNPMLEIMLPGYEKTGNNILNLIIPYPCLEITLQVTDKIINTQLSIFHFGIAWECISNNCF